MENQARDMLYSMLWLQDATATDIFSALRRGDGVAEIEIDALGDIQMIARNCVQYTSDLQFLATELARCERLYGLVRTEDFDDLHAKALQDNRVLDLIDSHMSRVQNGHVIAGDLGIEDHDFSVYRFGTRYIEALKAVSEFRYDVDDGEVTVGIDADFSEIAGDLEDIQVVMTKGDIVLLESLADRIATAAYEYGQALERAEDNYTWFSYRHADLRSEIIGN